MPEDLTGVATYPFRNKIVAYSQKTRCLREFQRVFEETKNPKTVTPVEDSIYKFFIDMAGPAWALYQEWKTHQGFKGTGLRAIERDERGRIVNVRDGIVFPIVAALSVFAKQKSGRWRLSKIEQEVIREVIGATKEVYMEVAESNPQTMGKTKACYSGLYRITSILAKGVYRAT
jgi:hypothetical protein